jgi:hypothetical protein
MANEVLAMIPARAPQTALEPTSVAEAFTLAQKLVQSGLLGRSIQKAEGALAIILTGRELGLTTMQSLRSIHIIEGKPSLSADLMVALVKRSPVCEYFKLITSTGTVATYETSRRGEGVTCMSFTIEQANAAGVASKQVWKSYPDAMLRARCIAALARAVYPDLLAGIYESESGELDAPEPMPRASRPAPVETVPAPKEDVIDVEPMPVPDAAEETDDEKIARWTDTFTAAKDGAACEAIRKAYRAEHKSDRVRKAVDVVIREKRESLRADAEARAHAEQFRTATERTVGSDDNE